MRMPGVVPKEGRFARYDGVVAGSVDRPLSRLGCSALVLAMFGCGPSLGDDDDAGGAGTASAATGIVSASSAETAAVDTMDDPAGSSTTSDLRVTRRAPTSDHRGGIEQPMQYHPG